MTRHTKVVLCFEDNKMNQLLVEKVFKSRIEAELLMAKNAAEGLALAKSHEPDLVLMDIDLPDMDGYQATAALRQMPNLQNVPVIAVSALATHEQVEEGRKADFVDYITKPFDLDYFIGIVRQHLFDEMKAS